MVLNSGPPPPPNVVLIIIDTLRADKLGCYGFLGSTSPEVDAMAGKGVLFKKVVSQSSWTRPSIASMLTALYPRSVGIFKEKYDLLHNRYVTLAEILKARGYRTFGITANPTINSLFNFNQGFDQYMDSTVIFKFMKPEEGKARHKPGVVPLPRSREIFQACLDMARSKEREPGYFQINIMEVHEGLAQVRPEFLGFFWGHIHHGYLAAIRQVSKDIGDFVDALHSISGWENTLFVITSDHGERLLGDHPGVFQGERHGDLLYESQLFVPLIFYHPGGRLQSRTIGRTVQLLDLMPTIVDYLGFPVPEGIHGKSLLGLIQGGESNVDLPDYFVAETNWRTIEKAAVYSSRWKYIENRDQYGGTDPCELVPLGVHEDGCQTNALEKEPEIARAMRESLRSWEERYPKEKVTQPTHILSEKEKEQLEKLGYLK